MARIRFTDRLFDGAEEHFGGLSDKLMSIVDDAAFNVFGEDARKAPTDIEITPAVTDEPIFVIQAWHETESSEYPGRMQVHDLSFRLVPLKEDIFISTEAGSMYPLTTRETLLLMSIGNMALIKGLLSSQPPEGLE